MPEYLCFKHCSRWDGKHIVDYSAGHETCYQCQRLEFENESMICCICRKNRPYGEGVVVPGQDYLACPTCAEGVPTT